MEKNDTVVVTAESVGTQGEGVAKCGGVTLFVPGLLPGERARVRVLKVKGTVGYGKPDEIMTPAEERVRPACPVFARCGGCQLQHMRYRNQLRFKTGLVKETLRKIAGLDVPVAPCERSEKEYGYRNKLQLPVGRTGEENVVGFYAERSHRIVPTDECPIHPAWSKAVIAALKGFMEKCGLDGYDEETGKGQIRHLVVRELKNKFLVTLVTTESVLKGIDYFTFLLDAVFPEYSLYLNVNREKTNVVFGEQFILVKGKGAYECSEGGIVYEAGPNTFVQVNDGVRAKLYERVVSLAGTGECAVDCYAGGGLLTAMLAQKCGKAYGVEIVPEASAYAARLGERNGLAGRMICVTGSVESELEAILEREKDALVVLDPPRSGVGRSVIETLRKHRVKKIVMISCNPATLARDLGLLTGSLTENERGELVKGEPSDYDVSLVQPYDMFPQTRHVETLVVLSHKKPDGQIGVKVEFGEEDGRITVEEVR